MDSLSEKQILEKQYRDRDRDSDRQKDFQNILSGRNHMARPQGG